MVSFETLTTVKQTKPSLFLAMEDSDKRQRYSCNLAKKLAGETAKTGVVLDRFIAKGY